MPYLLDYLENQFASFNEKPFNAIDAAVLSQVCMMRGKGVIPGLKERSSFANMFTVLQNTASSKDKPAHFRDMLMAEYYADMFTGLDPKRIKRCLFGIASSPRFREMTVSNYLSLFDVEREMQFAAMTFVQEKDFSVVTFRGTDATRTGWKEDFNMAYSMPVPAQEQALQYLETVAPKLPGKLYINGHSKGGNLAEYAALKASPALQARIERVYILDGPGFKEGIFTEADYEPIIDRMYKIVPEDSIIGIILESPVPMHVVPSNSKGFGQHSVFTWEIAVDETAKAERDALEAAEQEAQAQAEAEAAAKKAREATERARAEAEAAALAAAAKLDPTIPQPEPAPFEFELACEEDEGELTFAERIASLGLGKKREEEALREEKAEDTAIDYSGIMGDDFVYLESLSDGATFVRDAISEWLKIYDDNQRLMLVEALFRALDASGASDVGSLISGGSRTMSLIAEATRNLEEDDKGMLSDAGRDFMEIARGHAAKRAKKGVALSGEKVAQGISAGAAQIAQALENAAARHVERLSELVEEEDAEDRR